MTLAKCVLYFLEMDRPLHSFSCTRYQPNDPTLNRILYTGGSDLLARVWQADKGPDFEPSIAMEAEGPITCLAASVCPRSINLPVCVSRLIDSCAVALGR